MPVYTHENLEQFSRQFRDAKRSPNCIRVCTSPCCQAAGADAILKKLQEETKTRGLDVEVRKTGCVGTCYAEPLVMVDVEGAPRAVYGHMDADSAVRILDEHVGMKKVVAEHSVPIVEELPAADSFDGIGPAGLQYRLVLRNCGLIDPTSLDHYIARGGYQALRKALFELGPEKTLEEVKKSGLRGRGGAGFPTGVKWAMTRAEAAHPKYVICNGDEGDPGAYMDGTVLASDPHAVVEGMLLAAYAIGSNQGYFYIRAEYPLAVERIENAIKQGKRSGLIGKNILGSDFCCDMEVRLGAGAYVCGEETALIASLEGRRGTPHPRPPYPSEKGLWGMPTCINNVETLANIAPIVERGGDWYASIGVGKSKGTKVFAITGKIKRPGLIEVPMGITLRQIIEDIGGGSATGRRIKAAQTGGPSGGVIPEKLFDTPVTYETLNELGSIMGSGGLIVMDESDSIVDVAKFYVGFNVEESCGKCAPCRIGVKQMHNLLEKIVAGKGAEEDLDTLKRLSFAIKRASLCGLGQSAPNPVLSTLRYFPQEYRAMLKQPEHAVAAT